MDRRLTRRTFCHFLGRLTQLARDDAGELIADRLRGFQSKRHWLTTGRRHAFSPMSPRERAAYEASLIDSARDGHVELYKTTAEHEGDAGRQQHVSRDRTKWRCSLRAFSAIPCCTNRRLLDPPLRDRSCGPDQVLEEGTIVHHGLPHVFCRNRMASMFLDDRARGTVVHDDIRVVHRDVLDALLEVANGIAASLHDVPNQPIGLEHRPGRLIDESRLDLLPFVGESPRLLCVQRGDVKTRGLGPPDIAGIPGCTVVLRTIPWAQPIAPPISDRHRGCDNHSQGKDYGNNKNDEHELLLIHSSSTSAGCRSHTGYAITAGSSGQP